MEGRATHSAIPAAVSPQLIPHKAERRFNTPIPAPFPRTSVNSSREGPEAVPSPAAPPDPGTAPGWRVAGPGPAAEPGAVAGGPRSPGRGMSFVSRRLLGSELRPLCATLCFAPHWFSGWDQAQKQQVWLCISSHPLVGVYIIM